MHFSLNVGRLQQNPTNLVEYGLKNKPAEQQLWREHTRELGTDLQWLGWALNWKWLAFKICNDYWYMYILKITGFGRIGN